MLASGVDRPRPRRGLLLGLVETFVSAYVDPGLTLAATYSIFLVIILWRPQGLFGKASG